jgi:hypothetical protein
MTRSAGGSPAPPGQRTGVRLVRAACLAALAFFTGTVAAVLSHVAIDVLGDYLLAHDTYDRMAHESRGLFGAAALAVATAVAIRYCCDLLNRRASSSLVRGCGVLALREASGWRFFAPVAAIAAAMLLGMESVDCWLAAKPVHGISDLAGGSLWLGGLTTIASAALVSAAVRAVARLIAEREPQIAAFIVKLLRASGCPAAGPARTLDPVVPDDERAPLSRCASKRAPPVRVCV